MVGVLTFCCGFRRYVVGRVWAGWIGRHQEVSLITGRNVPGSMGDGETDVDGEPETYRRDDREERQFFWFQHETKRPRLVIVCPKVRETDGAL